MNDNPRNAVPIRRKGAWRVRSPRRLLLLSMAWLPPSAALAATTVTTFAINMTIQATCVVSALPLNFATYTGTLLTGTTTVTVTCTNTTPYTVGLNAGTATSATVTTRKMTYLTNTLGYVLTSDSAHTVNWGVTIGTDTVAGTGNGSAQPLTVYGQIAAGQYTAPGAYTVTATVTY
jgi:spore coat protein U-like protein